MTDHADDGWDDVRLESAEYALEVMGRERDAMAQAYASEHKLRTSIQKVYLQAVEERDSARGFCLAADQDAKAAEAEVDRLTARAIVWRIERDRLRRLVIEAYPGDYPTNGWRKRAEDLDAWPGAALAKEDTDE